MSGPLDHPISSLPEYLEATHELAVGSARRRLWFRGVHDARYPLVPRLYRSNAGVEELHGLEREMFAEFRSRSRSLLTPDIASDWERMFVMQHYGAPTRLLDWSENTLYTLSFALSGAAYRGFAADAAVWVIDPAGWNRAIYSMEAPGNTLLCVGEAPLDAYEPGRRARGDGGGGGGVVGALQQPADHGSARSVHGVRAGQELTPGTCSWTRASQAVLTCLRLPKTILADLNDQVRLLGFRESMIYPDLSGLATEIRVEHGLP